MKTKQQKQEQKIRIRMHNYYINNKDRWEKYAKKPQTQEQKLAKNLKKQKWKEEHPEKYLLSGVKYRSTKENIKFNLELKDIIVPKVCPYLGIKLTSQKGKGYLDNLMSIDRVDSKKGYVKGNVEIISYKANRMKNDASIKELLIFAKNIIKLYD